ncbi:serine/threonine-protein kinase Nek3 [Babesia caballi]|uniref:non-specific serine/threonine protein kinase n=1 Tax=Babesia caballi TaxID=5871 RepID=A0AAV4LL69_BABCB|nr:serine/threonine-protein kinase Nek3 [Babesia caballi]
MITKYLAWHYDDICSIDESSVDVLCPSRKRSSRIAMENGHNVEKCINFVVTGEGASTGRTPVEGQEQTPCGEPGMADVSKPGEMGRRNIICQHDWFVADDRLVMMYENCAGGDLHTLIATARKCGMRYFDESFIRDIFTQVCKGVEYFHKHGVVHGDIKASNVLFKDSGKAEVKIGDYDTCHVAGISSHKSGTLMYTAPEILVSSGACTSFESDVWALGCLLYELLTLSHPFLSPCTVESMTVAFGSFGAYKKELLARIPGDYSVAIVEVLVAALQVDPKLRPTVSQLLAMLEPDVY